MPGRVVLTVEAMAGEMKVRRGGKKERRVLSGG